MRNLILLSLFALLIGCPLVTDNKLEFEITNVRDESGDGVFSSGEDVIVDLKLHNSGPNDLKDIRIDIEVTYRKDFINYSRSHFAAGLSLTQYAYKNTSIAISIHPEEKYKENTAIIRSVGWNTP